ISQLLINPKIAQQNRRRCLIVFIFFMFVIFLYQLKWLFVKLILNNIWVSVNDVFMNRPYKISGIADGINRSHDFNNLSVPNQIKPAMTLVTQFDGTLM